MIKPNVKVRSKCASGVGFNEPLLVYVMSFLFDAFVFIEHLVISFIFFLKIFNEFSGVDTQVTFNLQVYVIITGLRGLSDHNIDLRLISEGSVANLASISRPGTTRPLFLFFNDSCTDFILLVFGSTGLLHQ